jgi:hypothetical protein
MSGTIYTESNITNNKWTGYEYYFLPKNTDKKIGIPQKSGPNIYPPRV